MVNLTPVAVEKVKEILTQQNPVPAGLRVAVVGGGCSGFSYHMAFESAANENNITQNQGVSVTDGISLSAINHRKDSPRSTQRAQRKEKRCRPQRHKDTQRKRQPAG